MYVCHCKSSIIKKKNEKNPPHRCKNKTGTCCLLCLGLWGKGPNKKTTSLPLLPILTQILDTSTTNSSSFLVGTNLSWTLPGPNSSDTMIALKLNVITLQGINISHLGKRKIIFKMPFFGGYASSLEGICNKKIGGVKTKIPVFLGDVKIKLFNVGSPNYMRDLLDGKLGRSQGVSIDGARCG